MSGDPNYPEQYETVDVAAGHVWPANTVARATVRGFPNVLVLRRKTDYGMDWAHTLTHGFTCSNDDLVKDVELIVQAVP